MRGLRREGGGCKTCPKDTAPAERAKTEKEWAAAEQKATGIILTMSPPVTCARAGHGQVTSRDHGIRAGRGSLVRSREDGAQCVPLSRRRKARTPLFISHAANLLEFRAYSIL